MFSIFFRRKARVKSEQIEQPVEKVLAKHPHEDVCEIGVLRVAMCFDQFCGDFVEDVERYKLEYEYLGKGKLIRVGGCPNYIGFYKPDGKALLQNNNDFHFFRNR